MRGLLLLFAFAAAAWAQPFERPVPGLSIPLRGVVFAPKSAEGAPVLLLFHGGGGRAGEFEALGASRLAETHGVVLVALEDDGSGFMEPVSGQRPSLASSILDQLLPWLGQRFPAARDRRGRGVLGVSLGGFAALSLALDHPGAFAFAASLSGTVELAQWGPVEVGCLPAPIQSLHARAFGLPGSEDAFRRDLFRRIEIAKPVDLPFLHLACGVDDGFHGGSQRLAERMRALGIPHLFREGKGGHGGPYWVQELEAAIAAFRRGRVP